MYSRREVAWLFSRSARDAREQDECIAACATGWGATATSPSDDENTLTTYLRWLDVHRARATVLAALSAEHAQITALRVNGGTDEQIAAWTAASESTVRRRFIATIDAILEALGGELADTEAAPRTPMCVACGERPRTRVVTLGPKRRGQPRPRQKRPIAICRECATASAQRAGTQPPTLATLIEREAA